MYLCLVDIAKWLKKGCICGRLATLIYGYPQFAFMAQCTAEGALEHVIILCMLFDSVRPSSVLKAMSKFDVANGTNVEENFATENLPSTEGIEKGIMHGDGFAV